jgi:hypothetical protein
MRELEAEDVPSFTNFLRVEPAMFQEILGRVHDRIVKQDTNYRRAVPAGMRLAITLRFLATGASYRDLHYAFRVGRSTISGIVPEVCEAIVDEYYKEVVKIAKTPAEWKAVADTFEARWQVPHALGALNGKHIRMQCPDKSGSLYFNYKRFFSIILMGLVDADYKFIYVDVGAYGGWSDAQVFNESKLKKKIEKKAMGFPPPDRLTDDNEDTEYFMLGDDAFALMPWLMKPYPPPKPGHPMPRDQRIFNYRLSRGRRIVENAFGILSSRWRCLHTTMMVHPDHAEMIVLACVCLHNLMRIRYPTAQNNLLDANGEEGRVIPGTWRTEKLWVGLQVQKRQHTTVRAKQQRDVLKNYFMSTAGKVPWQEGAC